jgi:hypothetical protein
MRLVGYGDSSTVELTPPKRLMLVRFQLTVPSQSQKHWTTKAPFEGNSSPRSL